MNVVGYVRLSQDDKLNQETSITNQEKMIIDFCQRNDYNLIKVYNEGFCSSSDDKRPQFNEMISLAEKNLYKAIIVKDDTRFGRNQAVVITVISRLSAFGIKVLTTSGFDLTADETYTGVMAAMAGEVIKRGRISQRKMMEMKAQEGKVFGRTLFGYRLNNELIDGRLVKHGNWIIKDDEADIVRKIFHEYLYTDKETFKISYDLKMSEMTVYHMLKNSKYCGIFNYTKRNRDTLGNILRIEHFSYKMKNHQPIISEDMFNKVQEKLKKNCKWKIKEDKKNEKL